MFTAVLAVRAKNSNKKAVYLQGMSLCSEMDFSNGVHSCNTIFNQKLYYSQQCCVTNFKVAKRLVLNCSHHKENLITWEVVEVLANTTQKVMHKCIKPTHCTS